MEEQTVDLREVVGVIWRQKFVILALVVVTTGLATWNSMSQTPIYTATSKMVLRPGIAPAAFGGYIAREIGGPLGIEVSPESEAAIIDSSLIGVRVAKALGMAESDAVALAGSVEVTIETDELLQISAASPDPASAAALANEFAKQYIRYRRQSTGDALDGYRSDLRGRLESDNERVDELDRRIVRRSTEMAALMVNGGIPTSRASEGVRLRSDIERFTSERNEILSHMAGLRQRLDDAETAAGITNGGGEVIEPALVPSAASHPQPRRDGAAGFVLGIILGIGVAFLRAHFDDRIRSRQDAAHASEHPVVAAIPRVREWRLRTDPYLTMLADPGSASAESYRSMRQTLTAMGLGRSIRTVLITSGGAQAGKSTTAANLAVACAQAGMRTVVVSADLRRPRLHEFFHISSVNGVSKVLAAKLDLNEAIVESAVGNLWVLPSGPVVESPASLLDGSLLDQMIRDLLDFADVVIIDGPPIGAGADAMVLAPRSDLVVMTLRRGRARASGTAAGVAMMTQAGARRQVLLLNMADEKTRAYIPDPGAYAAPAEVHGDGKLASSLPWGNGHANGNGTNGNGNGSYANGAGEAARSRATTTEIVPKARKRSPRK